MKLRRIAIKRIISIISVLPFLSKESFACSGGDWSGPWIEVLTLSKNLKKFYVGNMNDFLHREYKNIWVWDRNINITSGRNNENPYNSYTIERRNLAPITISSSIKYNRNEMYCSKIDVMYSDKRSDGVYAIYFIASINLTKKAIPYYSTRIRMSSKRAKIYAAFTFRNILTNTIIETKISSLPANLKYLSCAPHDFWYVDA